MFRLSTAALLANFFGLITAANYGTTTTVYKTYTSTWTSTYKTTYTSTYTSTYKTTSSCSTSHVPGYTDPPTFTSCSAGLRPTYTNTVITFDDLKGTAPLVAGPQMNMIPAGEGKLYWQDGFFFDVSNDINVDGTLDIDGGIPPHSLPVEAYFPFSTEFENGIPRASVYYNSSRTLSFSVHNFYYGFIEDLDNDQDDLPAIGVVTMTGYRGAPDSEADQQICAHTYKFLPTTVTGVQQLTFTGQIGDCTNVQFVEWHFQGYQDYSTAALTADIAFLLDDFNVTIWYCN